MIKNQRQAEIMEILQAEGFGAVQDLSRRLFASQPTIRRDLIALEKEGLICRNHGGAIPVDSKTNAPIQFRKTTCAKEKAEICKLAYTLLRPDSLIFTDASTTVSFLFDYIRPSQGITVVTNGLGALLTLADKGISVFSTGGRFAKSSEAFVGRQAEDTASAFNADFFFFSSSAMDGDGTISDYSDEETALRMVMKKRSERSVLLINSEKLGKKSAFRLFSLAEIDYIVTDQPLSQDLLSRYGLRPMRQSAGAILYEKGK